MLYRRVVPAIAVLCAIGPGSFAQKAVPRAPVIRQVDHILVESRDPKPLFDFFAETLLLPVAWPLAESAGFLSGGLGAGNVNLEFFRTPSRAPASARKDARARYAGLAFEPYPLTGALRELEARGIPHDPPESYASILPDGTRGAAYVTVALSSFARPGMSIFLYEYSPAFLKVDVRRKQLGNRLTLNNGGPLGLQSVREIVVATSRYEEDAAAWSKLLGKQTASGNWQPVGGPAIRLARDSGDGIRELVFKVASLDRAQVFLKKARLSGTVSAKRIFLDPAKIQGLRIQLVDGNLQNFTNAGGSH